MLKSNELVGFGGAADGAVEFPALSDLVFRYRADQGVTGDPTVTAWNDISGNGHHLDSAGGNPQLGTDGPNGTACITFDGSDYLNMGGTTYTSEAAPYSIWIVLDVINWVANSYVLTVHTGNNQVIQNRTTDGLIKLGAGLLPSCQVSITEGQFHCLRSTVNGASSFQSLDGTDTSTANIGTQAANTVSLSANTYNGNISNQRVCELWMTGDDTSGAETAALEAYVADRYSITFA